MMKEKSKIAFLGSDQIALPFLERFSELFQVAAFARYLPNRIVLRGEEENSGKTQSKAGLSQTICL